MRKPDFCLCENSNCEADQRLCFRSLDSPFSTFIQNFKLLAVLRDYTGRFVSNLVGNPEDRFSRGLK